MTLRQLSTFFLILFFNTILILPLSASGWDCKDLIKGWKAWTSESSPEDPDNIEKLAETNPFKYFGQNADRISPDLKGFITLIPKSENNKNLSLIIWNGTNLEPQFNGKKLKASNKDQLTVQYPIPEKLFKNRNILYLRIINSSVNFRDEHPGIFLAGKECTDRFNSYIINLSGAELNKGNPIDLSGPVHLKLMNDKDYGRYKNNPAETEFPLKSFWFTNIPSHSLHLLKNRKFGHLMYKFSINMQTLPKRPIALTFDSITGPDELYLDGILIGSTGKHGDKTKLYYDKIRSYILPKNLLTTERPMEITIITSKSTNTVLGTIEGTAFSISDLERSLVNFYTKETIALAIIAVYLIIGFYYGLLFLQRPKSKEYLFFFFATVSLGVYFFLRSQMKYQFFDDFYILKKMEYVVLFFMVPCFGYFMHFFFEPRQTITEKLFRLIFYCYIPLAIATIGIPIISSDINTWNTTLPYVQFTWSITIVYAFYLMGRESIYFVLKIFSRMLPVSFNKFLNTLDKSFSVFRKGWNSFSNSLPSKLSTLMSIDPPLMKVQVNKTLPDGALMIFALCIMIGSAVHDVLLDQKIITGTRITTYGTLMFILGIAGILSNRILRLYKKVGFLNRDLKETIIISEKRAEFLQGIIKGINTTSVDLVTMSQELINVENKFSLLAEEQNSSSLEMKDIFNNLTQSGK